MEAQLVTLISLHNPSLERFFASCHYHNQLLEYVYFQVIPMWRTYVSQNP